MYQSFRQRGISIFGQNLETKNILNPKFFIVISDKMKIICDNCRK